MTGGFTRLPLPSDSDQRRGLAFLGLMALMVENEDFASEFAAIIREYLYAGGGKALWGLQEDMQRDLERDLKVTPQPDQHRILEWALRAKGRWKQTASERVADDRLRPVLERVVPLAKKYVACSGEASEAVGMALGAFICSGQVQDAAQRIRSDAVLRALIEGDATAKPGTLIQRKMLAQARKQWHFKNVDTLQRAATAFAVVRLRHEDNAEVACASGDIPMSYAKLTAAISPFYAALGIERKRGRKAHEQQNIRLSPTYEGAWREHH